jgi:2-keto-4-pentenoate hydratase
MQERMRRGDRVITGSIAQIAVSEGDDVVADFGALGRVQIAIA